MYITKQTLKAADACIEAVRRFKKMFGGRAELTPYNIKRAFKTGGMHLWWLRRELDRPFADRLTEMRILCGKRADGHFVGDACLCYEISEGQALEWLLNLSIRGKDLDMDLMDAIDPETGDFKEDVWTQLNSGQ